MKVLILIKEEALRKIKYKLIGGINNLGIEELCKYITNLNKEIIVDIFNLKVKYSNKKKKIDEIREQKIIVLSIKKLLDYFDKNKCI